jgi:hypothetical protein
MVDSANCEQRKDDHRDGSGRSGHLSLVGGSEARPLANERELARMTGVVSDHRQVLRLSLTLVVLVLASCGQEHEERQTKLFGFNSALSLWAVAPNVEVRHERAVGANAQRYTASWRDLQPRAQDPPLPKGGPLLARLDGLYRELVKADMTPIVIPGNAPEWAAGQEGSSWLPPDRQHVEHWARFVEALAERYPRAVIEPWNEPNYKRFWRGAPLDPNHMARLQCAAYNAIPRNRTVLSAGLTVRGGFTAYASTFQGRARRCYDALSVHLYDDVEGRLRTAKRVLANGTPIWVTETGAASIAGQLTERQQADRNAQIYDELTAEPDVRALLFNTLRDAQDPPLVGHPEKAVYHYGFLRVDFTAKPTYCEFAKRAAARPPGC